MKLKKKSRLARIIDLAFSGILAFGVLHGATQLVKSVHDYSKERNPSRQRAEFKEHFGFPIVGYRKYIEEDPESLTDVIYVLNKEKAEGDFDLTQVAVVPRNYLKKSFPEQIGFLIDYKTNGYYDNKTEFVGVVNKPGNIKLVLTHEIKHRKEDLVSRVNKSLFEKWDKLARDENGNSLYGNSVLSKEELLQKGFVDNYASRNIKEDIAETAAFAEISPPQFYQLIEGSKKNPRISGKIDLLVEYGLLPKDFRKFVQLKNYFKDAMLSADLGISRTREYYLEQSRDFLEKSNGIYSCEVHRDRGELYKELALKSKRKFEKPMYLRHAIFEFEQALKSDFKDVSYSHSLKSLAICNSLSGNEKEARIFENAYQEYETRAKTGDTKLTSIGVNDYLESKGISLDPHEHRTLTNICGGEK